MSQEENPPADQGFEILEVEETSGPNSPFGNDKVLAGKYRIDRVIGLGLLSVVVAARHLQLDQLVAIKYLQAKSRGNPSVVARFLREARLATKIRSDHAVHIHDIELLPDGTPYIVMDHLEGMDLRKILEGGPLLIKRAVDYIVQCCDALADAHAAGVIHAGLKPENLFLSRKTGGAVIKVLDFGLAVGDAKKGDSARARELACEDRLVSPGYLAPEQLAVHDSIDERADIWALGVLLYELVTGTLPFGDGPGPAVCAAIAERPPTPLAEALPNIPEGFEAVLTKCLAKPRDQRYRNVAELAIALSPWAPSATLPRIERIARVIAEAGWEVPPLPPRPMLASTPPPGIVASTPPPPAVIMPAPGAVENDDSWAMQHPPFRPRRGMKVAVAALLVGGVAVAALVREALVYKPLPAQAATTPSPPPRSPVATETPPPPASPSSAQAAAAAAAASAPAPSAEPQPEPEPTPAASEVASAEPHPAGELRLVAPPPKAAPAPRPASAAAPPRKRPKPAPAASSDPAATSKPAPSDPDAVLNPFN